MEPYFLLPVLYFEVPFLLAVKFSIVQDSGQLALNPSSSFLIVLSVLVISVLKQASPPILQPTAQKDGPHWCVPYSFVELINEWQLPYAIVMSIENVCLVWCLVHGRY